MKKQYFLCLIMLLSALWINAQNITVSDAGSTDANGTYIENGTSPNGKPQYVMDGDPSWELKYDCFMMACEGWAIVFRGMDEFYYANENVATPDLVSSWSTGMMGMNPAPTVEVEGKSVSYSTPTFLESQSLNDGSLVNTITITHNEFDGDFFTGTYGENYITEGKVTVSNVPAGLTGSIVKQSNSELLFSLSGSADAHTNLNDIANLTVVFNDSAFNLGNAISVSNSSKNDLNINFIEVFTVASSGGNYTLIQNAIDAASNFDVIDIAAETFTLTSALSVNKSLLIKGQGAGKTIIQGNASVTTTGNDMRLIYASFFSDFKLHDLTIRYASHSISSAGGAMYLRDIDNLEILRCQVSGNRATNRGANGAGVYILSVKNAMISDCLFKDNAITNAESGYGAGGSAIAVRNTTYVTVQNSTFTNNNLIYNGTDNLSGGSLLIFDCPTAKLINSTFTNNEGYQGGAVSTIRGILSITNSVLYGNTASNAGADLYRNGGTINVTNSIIGASAASTGSAVNGTSTNLSTSNPLFNTLANNGGPTQTISIQAGSPAIDAGLENSDVPITDQRGYFANGIRDLGAFEFEGFAIICDANAALAPSGAGTQASPYQITNLRNLRWISENSSSWNAYFEQTANIDAAITSEACYNSGQGFSPIGNATIKFTGSYTGNSHSISNLFINRNLTSQALFGHTDGATISKVQVLDATINAETKSGILVGYGQNGTSIEDVVVSGSVSGSLSTNFTQVGGICGYLGDSFITKAVSYAHVDGNHGSLGSLVGYSSGTTVTKSSITNSFSTGSVTSNNNNTFVGSLIGGVRDTDISNVYATGIVANTNTTNVGGLVGGDNGGINSVLNSFYNTTTTGKSVSAVGGTGKTTAEMKQASTFLESTWDFISANVIWGVNQMNNSGYPFLRHQGFTSDHIWLAATSTSESTTTNWSEEIVPVTSSAIRIPSKIASNNNNLEIGSSFEVSSVFVENTNANLLVLPTKSLKVSSSINNEGMITFKSDATGDSYLDQFFGTIKGNGKVVSEKYYPFKRAFRIITSSINGGSIFDNWQNGGNTVLGQGTHITGEIGTVGNYNSITGIDYTSQGNPSLFTFDKTNGWEAVVNTKTTNLQAGVPYRLMVRGDRGIDLNNNDASSETTLYSEGTLFTGNQVSTPQTVGSTTFYSFVANPYQSRINIKNLLDANLDANKIKFWVWDPMVNTRGGFVVIDDLTSANGTPTPSSSATKFIEPGQAFFIEVTNGTPSIQFTETIKDVNITQAKSSTQNTEKQQIMIELLNEKKQAIDAIRLRFSADGDNGIETYDAGKLSNMDENLASVNENRLFTVQSRNLPGDAEMVSLFMNNWRNENYSLKAHFENIENTEVYLIDNYLGSETLIKHGDLYYFSVDASIADSKSTQRFELKFSKTTLGVDDIEQNSFSVYPNPAKDIINIQTSFSQTSEVEISLYDMLGKKLKSSKQQLENNRFQMEVNDLQEGIYILELTDQKGNHQSKKFIKN